MNIGWIKLHREIQEHWIFQDPIKFKYWVQILMKVNHKQGEIILGNKVFIIEKGQSACSLRTWALTFNCSVKTVNSFFELLKNNGMIEVETIGKGKQSTTLVTVSNYTTYQAIEETQSNTQSNTQDTTQGKRKGNAKGTQYKNVENDKNEKEIKIIEQFELFWDLYGKKTDKEKTLKKFKLLSDAERTELLSKVESYVKSTPEVKFRKNPLTWLNGKCWKDEVESPKKPKELDDTKVYPLMYVRNSGYTNAYKFTQKEHYEHFEQHKHVIVRIFDPFTKENIYLHPQKWEKLKAEGYRE